MNKKKVIGFIILGVLVITLVFLLIVLSKKDSPEVKKDKAERKLSEYGAKFYEHYYDILLGENGDNIKTVLENYKNTGLTITVKDLKIFLDTYREEDYSMFDECDKEQTKVTITPIDPYEKDSYNTSVILDCDFIKKSTESITEEEKSLFQEYINKVENYGFVYNKNIYNDASEIDLNYVFYDGHKVDITEEEKKEVFKENATEGAVFKVTVEEAKKVFLEKTGVELENINDRFKWVYSDKYKAFYDQHTDSGAYDLKVESGTKKDGTYVLKITNGNNKKTTLTIKDVKGKYYFISNKKEAN